LVSSVSIHTKKVAALSKTLSERYEAETNIKISQNLWRKTTSIQSLCSHQTLGSFSAAACSWQWTSVSLLTHTDRNNFTILTPTSTSSQLKLKECQNMIYIQLIPVNLPVTVTNKRTHVAKRLVKGKAIPLQALTGSEVSRRLRHLDLKTIGTRW
jgi:hypothetical protein